VAGIDRPADSHGAAQPAGQRPPCADGGRICSGWLRIAAAAWGRAYSACVQAMLEFDSEAEKK